MINNKMNDTVDFINSILPYYYTFFVVSMTGFFMFFTIYDIFADDHGEGYLAFMFGTITTIFFANMISFAMPPDYRFMMSLLIMIPSIMYIIINIARKGFYRYYLEIMRKN